MLQSTDLPAKKSYEEEDTPLEGRKSCMREEYREKQHTLHTPKVFYEMKLPN